MSRQSLSILDVGHGNAAVLVDINGIVVIDAGPGSSLLEFLKNEGIEKIDVILISHADSDHVKGLVAILASGIFTFGKIRLNSDALKKSDLWGDLLYLLQKEHNASQMDFNVALTTRDTGTFDQGDVHIEILAPSLFLAGKGPGSTDRNYRSITTNSISAVIRLSKDGVPFAILPGDIDQTGLDNLLEDSNDTSATIAVFPHHGGRSGGGNNPVVFTRAFCENVKPDLIIFSNGRGMHDTPRKEIIDTIKDTLPDTRIVCTQLSEHCVPTLPSEEQNHLTEKFARGKEKSVCCAGTIVVELSELGIRIQPDEDSHRMFIEKVASSPLC